MKNVRKYRSLYLLVVGFLLFYILFKVFSAVSGSLFFSRPARMNVIVYGPTTTYYSVDSQDNQNYRIQFDPEVKVDVPGGYGQYRIGSLGKLVTLEKDPDIFRKTFSTTTTTFVHYYFYKESDDIYYNELEETSIKPSVRNLLLLSSNASFLDRIYLSMLLSNGDAEYKNIRYQKETNEALRDTLFKDKSFIKDSIGLLYNNDYRDEQQSIQVLYRKSYKTAQSISSVLEGNGIRVSDINKNTSINDCRVMISKEIASQTAKDIAKYFSCSIVKGKTDVYDILFVLGNREEEWKVN